MKGIILAAGKGTRLRPVTLEIPKPLVPVQKKPIASHLTELYSRYGINDIKVVVNREHAEDFSAWKNHQLDQEIASRLELVIEEDRTGTFGPLHRLRDWLTEPVVVSNGDELKDLNLSKFKEFHDKAGATASIGLVKVPNPQDYGVAVLNDKLQIDEFIEKPQNPPSSYINSGIYIFDPDILKYYPTNSKFSMLEQDLFPVLAKQGELFGYKWNGHWYDCGTLERWEDAINKWPQRTPSKS